MSGARGGDDDGNDNEMLMHYTGMMMSKLRAVC
jgi:hypothetical protein